MKTPSGTDRTSAGTLDIELPGLESEAGAGRQHADHERTTKPTTANGQLLAVIEGDHAPFSLLDEVDQAWRPITPVLRAWSTGDPESYEAGSAGPANQAGMLHPDHSRRALPSSTGGRP